MIADRLLVFAFEKLDSLEVGQEITELTTKNWDIFLECAKQYHQCYKNILFSNDYKRIRKTLTYQETINTFKTYDKA